MIERLRTPDDGFKNLPNFLYKSQYFEDLKGYANFRMQYTNEGLKDAKYTFLYRDIISRCSKLLRLKKSRHFFQKWGDIVAIKVLEHFNL